MSGGTTVARTSTTWVLDEHQDNMVVPRLRHSYMSKAGVSCTTSFFVLGQTILGLETDWDTQQQNDRGRLMMAIGSTIGKAMGSNLIQRPVDILYSFPKTCMLPNPTERDEWLEGCRLIVLNIEYLTQQRPCCPRCGLRSVESKGWDVQHSKFHQQQGSEVHSTWVVFREWQCKHPACKKGKFKETSDALLDSLPTPLCKVIRQRLRPLCKPGKAGFDEDDSWLDSYPSGFEMGLGLLQMAQAQAHAPSMQPHTPSIPASLLTQVSPSPDTTLPESAACLLSAGSTSTEASHALQDVSAPALVPTATAGLDGNVSTSPLLCIADHASALMMEDSDMADAALALQALSGSIPQAVSPPQQGHSWSSLAPAAQPSTATTAMLPEDTSASKPQSHAASQPAARQAAPASGETAPAAAAAAQTAAMNAGMARAAATAEAMQYAAPGCMAVGDAAELPRYSGSGGAGALAGIGAINKRQRGGSSPSKLPVYNGGVQKVTAKHSLASLTRPAPVPAPARAVPLPRFTPNGAPDNAPPGRFTGQQSPRYQAAASSEDTCGVQPASGPASQEHDSTYAAPQGQRGMLTTLQVPPGPVKGSGGCCTTAPVLNLGSAGWGRVPLAVLQPHQLQQHQQQMGGGGGGHMILPPSGGLMLRTSEAAALMAANHQFQQNQYHMLLATSPLWGTAPGIQGWATG